MVFIDEWIAIAVNSKIVLYSLSSTTYLQKVCEVDSQILVYKMKCVGKNELIVADVMKSLSVYKLTINDSKPVLTPYARYPNGQWCFDMHKVD